MPAKPPIFYAWLTIALVFVIHLIIAPLIPLGVDEAHYALYALHPDLSYFDHPPMVAWLQMLVSPLGYDEFSIRLMPTLLYAIASLKTYQLTQRLYPDGDKNQSLVAVVLLNSAPILQLMGWGMVPDAPLIVLALFAVDVIIKITQENRLRHWLLLGIIYGLAGLSKYTAVFLPLAMMLFFSQQQRLRWLAQRGPWLAIIPALLLISPVLIWNGIHDWASFNYQINHASGTEWSLTDALKMQVLQIACYSALAYIAGIAATIFAIKRGRQADWLVIWHAWPFLIVTTWSAGNGELLPNWPALGWAMLTPLTAHWLCISWSKVWVKVLTLLSSIIAIGLITFIFAFLAFQPLSLLPALTPAIRDLVGWDQAASTAQTLLANRKKDPHHHPPVILLENWTKGSRIAWYARPLPVQILSDRNSQFRYWFGEADKNSHGILIRDNEDIPESGIYHTRGLSCHYLQTQEGKMDGVIANTFHFYWCHPQVNERR